MQRWHLTAILGVAALSVYPLVKAHFAAPGPAIVPPPPRPIHPSITEVTPQGALHLHAQLAQSAIPAGQASEQFVVLEVTADKGESGDRRPVHLAVVIDSSGSMAAKGKISHARTATAALLEGLDPQDSLSLVSFDSKARVVGSTETHTPLGLTGLLNDIRPSGGTNLHHGLSLGLETLEARDGVKRVLVLSDGMANIGIVQPKALQQLAAAGIEGNTTVSAMGLGLDFNEDLLSAMSDAGGGSYAYVDSPNALTSMFHSEFEQMTRVVGQQTVVDLTLPTGVRLSELYGYTDLDPSAEGIRVRLGDVHAGESRKIVARVAVDPQASGEVDLGDVKLSYLDAGLQKEAEQTRDVLATATTSAKRLAQKADRKISEKVVTAVLAKEIDRAARVYGTGQVSGARRALDEGEAKLQALGGNYDFDAGLIDDVRAYRQQMEPASAEERTHRVKRAKEEARDLSHF